MHFLTRTAGRLHTKGSHAKKFNPKDSRIERWFYDLHSPKYASIRYLRKFSFDRFL